MVEAAQLMGDARAQMSTLMIYLQIRVYNAPHYAQFAMGPVIAIVYNAQRWKVL